jgi:5-methylcytosine-specific restriction endonuclease McrBC GTP-binding regulatory subunit McrB
MLFEKVKKEHILQGIKDFEEKGLPNGFGASSTYDLVFENKPYPPKAIMAYANYYASGRKIERYFKGGLDTDCFKAFEVNGFKIEKKKNTMNENLYKLKIDFLEYWTLDRLQNMTLEEYTDTKRENSFCYWLEHLTRNLGSIVGGSSYKFGIYKMGATSKTESATNRDNDGIYAWHTKYGKTSSDAFYSIKNIIIDIAKYAKENNLKPIDSIDLGDAFKWKITFLYSDFKVLNIFKKSWLVNIVYGLDVGKENLEVSELNNLILAKKPTNEDFFDFSNRIRETYGDKEEDINNILSNFENWLKKVYRKKDGTPLGKGSITNYLSGIKSIARDLYQKDLLEKNQLFIINNLDVLENLHRDYFNIEEVVIKNNTGNNKIINSFSRFIEFKKSNQNQEMKYWIYAPGKNATYWNEFYQEGIMGLGWDSLGDLTKYPNKDAIEKKLQEFNNVTSSKRNNATANFEFANTMNIGDIIIVKTGRNTLLGYGIVTSDYYYDNTRNIYTSCRKVDWKLKGNWNVQKKLVLKTLTDITRYKEDDGTNYYDGLMKIMMTDSIKENEQDLITIPKNQILYGPPGTGKTYKTKELAVQISNPNFIYDENWSIIETREKIVKEYDRLCEKGQIVFTTFHQSMSYEDFVEGIKPKTENEKVTYEIENGIFKEISLKASQKTVSNFKEVYNQLIKEFSNNDNDFLTLKTPKDKEFRVRLNSNNNLSLFTTNKSSQQGTFTKEKLEQHLYHENAFNGWEGYANAILNYLKDKFKLSNKGINHRNYTLIIDEINRGNVSAVFGELITLLEDDKRIGQNEAIKITLPYSKDEFGVPSNLYIIGTMNTADRSVEALDTALRRRFSFTEVLPQAELLNKLEYKDVNLELLLSIINQRIELLIDKDHQIGHSYFLNINTLDSLKLVFKDKIIPLLEEYFYGDLGKIGLVLGEGFIKASETKNKSILAKFKSYSDIDFVSEKKIFRLSNIDEMSETDFISIYQGIEE